MKKKTAKQNNEKKQYVKHDPIIKLGSETETENGIYHLLGSKRTGYEVWKQPFEQWQGKKIRSYKNWHKVESSKKIGECRVAIKNAILQPPKKETHKTTTKITRKTARKR